MISVPLPRKQTKTSIFPMRRECGIGRIRLSENFIAERTRVRRSLGLVRAKL